MSNVDAIFQINFSCLSPLLSLSSYIFFLFLFFICRACFIYGSVYLMHQHFKVDICVNILLHHCMHYIKPRDAGNKIYLPDSLYMQNESSPPPSTSFSLISFQFYFDLSISNREILLPPKQIMVESICQVQHAKSIPHILLDVLVHFSFILRRCVSKCKSQLSNSHSLFLCLCLSFSLDKITICLYSRKFH